MSTPHDRLDDLHKLLEITRAMAAAADLDALLALIARRTCELLRAERATLFLYDADAGELVSRVATGAAEIRVKADRGIAGAVVRTGEVINVPDAYADPRFNPDVDKRTGFVTRSILAVPLHDHDGALVGVLQVLNKAGGPFDDYDRTLAQTFGAQAGVAVQRSRLIEHYLRKQQMERAMRIAREIQQNLLPQGAPHIADFDIAGRCEPADETGGDTFDFMPLPHERLLLTVADATGHGIGPALIIAEIRAMLRAVSLRETSAPDILSTVNDLVCADLGGERFVTCFCGVLQGHSLHYASAGHGPLVFYRRSDDSFAQVSATGMPLGIMEQAPFGPLQRFDFQPGDFAAITTDGFFEAACASGEQWGMRRLMDSLRASRDGGADAMIEAMRQDVRAFTGPCPQADDLTAVIIKRLR
jgi:phosphoserine phosphatase